MALRSESIEKHWPLIRDVLSFGVGTYVVIAQMGQVPKDPAMLAFGATLMGVPAALGLKKNGKG